MSIFGVGYPSAKALEEGSIYVYHFPVNFKLGIRDRVHRHTGDGGASLVRFRNVMSYECLIKFLHETNSDLQYVLSSLTGISVDKICNTGYNSTYTQSSWKKSASTLWIDNFNYRPEGEIKHPEVLKPTAGDMGIRSIFRINMPKNHYNEDNRTKRLVNRGVEPFTLASTAIPAYKKAEMESVFYCSYNTTPVERYTMNCKDLRCTPHRTGNKYYDDTDECPREFMNMITNDFVNVDTVKSGKTYYADFKNECNKPGEYERGYSIQTKDIQENTYFPTIDYLKDSTLFNHIMIGKGNVEIPKVRVNEWRIPVYIYPKHIADIKSNYHELENNPDYIVNNKSYNYYDESYNNYQNFYDDTVSIDIQIDFMPNPFTHLSEDIVGDIPSSREQHTYKQNETHKHIIEDINDKWAVGSAHTKFKRKRVVDFKFKPDGDKEFQMNKRADRHMRYKIKFHKLSKFNSTEYNFTECEKVYDSEADIPVSSGLIVGNYARFGESESNPRMKDHQIWCNYKYEGLYPDPEDLTNPTDLHVHFEHVHIDSEEQLKDSYRRFFDKSGLKLLGYVVIKGYSGLVGSTLTGGKFTPSAVYPVDKSGVNTNTITSYSNATRTHDTFFKVTFRVDKEFSSGIYGGSAVFPPTTLINQDFTKVDFSKGAVFPNVEEDSNGYVNGYKKSKDLMWGSKEFYDYRIKDNGGFIRMPAQDYLQWMDMYFNRCPAWRNDYTELNGGVGAYTVWERKYMKLGQNGELERYKTQTTLSGYINPMTSTLDWYYFSHNIDGLKTKLKSKNIGGQTMVYVGNNKGYGGSSGTPPSYDESDEGFIIDSDGYPVI